MALGRGQFSRAQSRLLRDQLPGDLDVARHEHAEREFEVAHDLLMEGLQLRRALFRESEVPFDLLLSKLHQILVDNVADVLQVDRERDDLHGTLTVPFVQTLAGEPCHIELDRLIELVDRVVHPADLGDKAAIVGHQCRHGLTQHGFDDVAKMKDLAFGAGECDRRGAEGRIVKIKGCRGIVWFRPLRQKSRKERGDPAEWKDEDSCQRQIEGGVEVRRHAGRVGFKLNERVGDRVQKRQRNSAADQAIDEIADRQAIAGRIAAVAAFNHRIDGASEIGTKCEGKCRHRRDEAGIGQRHDQQQDRDARVSDPGQHSGHQNAKQGVAGDRRQERSNDRCILGWCQCVEQDVQRQQHQPDPDRDAAEIARPGLATALECDDADQKQQRCHGRDIERERLNDQRRADVRPEHDGERRSKIDRAPCDEGGSHQPGRRAALQERRHDHPGEERQEAISQRSSQQASEIGAKGPDDAAVDHMQSPQQQRHAAKKIEEDHAAQVFLLSLASLSMGGGCRVFNGLISGRVGRVCIAR